MSAAPAAAPLDVARVRRTIAQLREHLAAAVQLLGELYDGRAWVALGLPSWEALCAQELPELGQLLSAAERRSLVVDLRARGLSLRAAAAPAGVSAATAKSWADESGVVLDFATGLDGRRRAGTTQVATRTPARGKPRTDRVAELLAAAGPDGLTVVEIGRALRWGREVVAPTLTRLAQSGRITYAPPARRGLFGRYVRRINP